MQADCENETVKKPRGMRHHIEMAIGGWIERACVKGNAWHVTV
jgi:hypothetical protein